MTLVQPYLPSSYQKDEPIPTLEFPILNYLDMDAPRIAGVEKVSRSLFNFNDYTNVRKLAKAIAVRNEPSVAALITKELVEIYGWESDYNTSAMMGSISQFQDCELKPVYDALYAFSKSCTEDNTVLEYLVTAVDYVMGERHWAADVSSENESEELLPARIMLEMHREKIDNVSSIVEEANYGFLVFYDPPDLLEEYIVNLARAIAVDNTTDAAGLLNNELSAIYQSNDYDSYSISHVLFHLDEHEMQAVIDVLLPLQVKNNGVAQALVSSLKQTLENIDEWNNL